MNGLTSEPTVPAGLGEAASVFADCRPQLLRVALRLLGDAAEAEDIVQETWIRWQTYDRSAVRNAPAFLATTTARLALNAARSARARRETPIGPWVPEPVDRNADPVAELERAEAVEFAVRLVVEALSPSERAAYVLRQAFDYPYEQIAGVIHQSQANARQLVSRARKHLAGKQRPVVALRDHHPLLGVFVAAATTGNLTALEELLERDVVRGAR